MAVTPPRIMRVFDEVALGYLPNGTIIEWLRTPEDPATACVAYVAHTGDTDDSVCVTGGSWTLRLSPVAAGVTYPVRVVEMGPGAVPPGVHRIYAVPTPPEQPADDLDPLDFGVLDSGGTWARQSALECAAHAMATWLPATGTTVGLPHAAAELTLTVATAFEEWLLRDPADEDPDVPEPRQDTRPDIDNEDDSDRRLARYADTFPDAVEQAEPMLSAEELIRLRAVLGVSGGGNPPPPRR